MSNNLLSNPIYLDTVGVTSAITYPIIITSVVWDGGVSGAAGDSLVLHDSSGGNIILSETFANGYKALFWTPSKPIRASGLYLTTLSRGVVLVYLK